MNVEVQIYLKNIQSFFENDEESFQELFGGNKEYFKRFLTEVTSAAEDNYNNTGIPTLSVNQLMGLVFDVTSKPINPTTFKFKDFPNIFLN